ncbi:MAG: putative sulfate exporter family transporter [Sporomusaceae bacterium]|nr:putative sulfate exporter family transporter [Sporomusaceae bacterium]
MSSEGDPSFYEQKPLLKSEDWWAVWLGLFIFLLGLAPIWGGDLLGWVGKHNVWIDAAKAFEPNAKAFAVLGGSGSAIATYLFLVLITTIGAWVMGSKPLRFAAGFTVIYWITFFATVLGNFAYIAATPDKQSAFKIGWSLSLGELGLVFSLVIGLIIGNFFPRTARFLAEAARPEWYIKTGIILLGITIGIKTVGTMSLAGTIIFRGLCAVVEAYLLYWPIVYFISRRYFKFTPEWAAPLASGISICGVAAAIATGGAVRSRPIVPTVLASIIIVFVAVELLFLPWVAAVFLTNEPMVAGAWMGLAVKSDGGAVASGAITDALIRSRALTQFGVQYQEGWILMAATTTKLFIDIFIGIWAFLLAVIWSVYGLNKQQGRNASGKVSPKEIWERFPKFVLGFFITFFALLLWGILDPSIIKAADTGAGQTNLLRMIFFSLCFFSIGLVTNVRNLWQAGVGKIVAVYSVSLFGFILWVGLFVSWLFYHGIKPPVIGG